MISDLRGKKKGPGAKGMCYFMKEVRVSCSEEAAF